MPSIISGQNLPPEGSGREVQDFTPYCEGDIEPSLHKKIQDLIDSDTDYIVYLDDEHFVQWAITDSYGDVAEEFGEIASCVALLETQSTALLSPERAGPFRRLLAEALARSL